MPEAIYSYSIEFNRKLDLKFIKGHYTPLDYLASVDQCTGAFILKAFISFIIDLF